MKRENRVNPPPSSKKKKKVGTSSGTSLVCCQRTNLDHNPPLLCFGGGCKNRQHIICNSKLLSKYATYKCADCNDGRASLTYHGHQSNEANKGNVSVCSKEAVERWILDEEERFPMETTDGVPSASLPTAKFRHNLKGNQRGDFFYIKERDCASIDYDKLKALTHPTVFGSTDYSGMIIPQAFKDPSFIFEEAKPGTLIEVFDSYTQERFKLTPGEVLAIQEIKQEDRCFKMVVLSYVLHDQTFESSLNVYGGGMMPLAATKEQIVMPEFVRTHSWLHKARPKKEAIPPSLWPVLDKLRSFTHLYGLYGEEGTFVNFHQDYSGTSFYYTVMNHGVKVFYIVEKTPRNERLMRESDAKSLNRIFIEGHPEINVIRFKVTRGQILYLPPGYIHAVLTVKDSVVYGGNFLSDVGVEDQCRMFLYELSLKKEDRSLFPHFYEINLLKAYEFMHDFGEPVKRKESSERRMDLSKFIDVLETFFKELLEKKYLQKHIKATKDVLAKIKAFKENL
uniref:JmjC domain-containing protein n=1 Tax=Rhabditophanes sp. KR3021 TaxID=114890 RepID=A0AC35TLB0_9BILA